MEAGRNAGSGAFVYTDADNNSFGWVKVCNIFSLPPLSPLS